MSQHSAHCRGHAMHSAAYRSRGSSLTLFSLALLAALAAMPGRPVAAQMTRSQFVPSFEYNNRIKGQLTKLETLEHQKLWDEWINTYQTLVDDNADAVMPRDKDDQEFLDGLRYRLHLTMGRLPAPVK